MGDFYGHFVLLSNLLYISLCNVVMIIPEKVNKENKNTYKYNPNSREVGTFCKMQYNQESGIYLVILYYLINLFNWHK